MTQKQQAKPAPQAEGRLWLFVLIQVVAGIILTVTGRFVELRHADLEFLPRVPAFSLILAQTCLIGLWAAMSLREWWVRLIALGLIITYLEVQLTLALAEDGFHVLVTVTTLTLASVLWLLRICRGELRRLTQGIPVTREGLQFSIRGLMIFTAVVGVLITAAKQLRPIVDGPAIWVISIWGICFVVANLAAIWAMLGLGKPLTRSVVVVIISLALGGFFGYVIDEGIEAYLYCTAITALQSLFLLGSLAFLRAEGYRFVGRVSPAYDGAKP